MSRSKSDRLFFCPDAPLLLENLPDDLDAFDVEVDAEVGGVEEKDDVEEGVAGGLVQGDVFCFVDGAGAQSVYGGRGVRAGDAGGSVVRRMKTAVLDAEHVALLPGFRVDAVADESGETVKEQEVEIADALGGGVQVFHGTDDEFKQGFVFAFVFQQQVEHFPPQQKDVHLDHVEVQGGQVEQRRNRVELLETASFVPGIFDFRYLHKVYRVVLPLEQERGRHQGEVAFFQGIDVDDFPGIRIRLCF